MSDFRKRILEPTLVPLVSVVFIGGLVWGMSRFLLVTSTEMAVAVAFVVSLAIVLVAAFMSTQNKFGTAQKIAVGLLGIGIAAGGNVAVAMIGIRPFHSKVEPDVHLVAKGIVFVEKQLTLPQVKDQYIVELENEDAGTPHNFALYRDRGFSQAIFKGPIFSGVAAQPNVFKSPGAGIYYFQCDVHPIPNMQGTLVIGSPPGAPPPAGGSSPGGAAPSPAAATHIVFALPLLRRRSL